MSGKIYRKREGKGERITLSVSVETKTKWEEVQKALIAKGYVIDTDMIVRRAIRSLEAGVRKGFGDGERRNVVDADK
jgi:hypothetical protein